MVNIINHRTWIKNILRRYNMTESQRFSFVGWKFMSWLKGNSKTIKELIKVGLPYAASTFVVDPIWQQFVITVLGKFILDSIDYWVSE